MQIYNIHESIIVMKSIDKKLAARVLSGLKPLGCASWY